MLILFWEEFACDDLVDLTINPFLEGVSLLGRVLSHNHRKWAMKASAVTLERYAHKPSETLRATQLVRCFQDVFADPPWNEWRKCSVCGKYWGLTASEELARLNNTHCGMPVVEYWPSDEVFSDLQHEITEEASCWLAVDEARVVGFCWGYPIAFGELERKLKIGFADSVEHQLGHGHRIAYQDELGVLSSYRGQKLAHQLYAKRHEDFLAQGLTAGVVRTRRLPEPSVTYLWFTERLGYKVLAEYPGDDGRVILGQTLDHVTKVLASST
jgi:GNAT superfamily N-acetyltransferase